MQGGCGEKKRGPWTGGLLQRRRRRAEVTMKKLTINEIAERAGVSKTTVSFYLNGKTNKMSDETKRRIQHIIDETGYEPNAAARAMKAKSSGMIGVILGDLADPYSCQALKGLEDAAGSQNIQVMVAGSGMNFNSEKEIVERMLKMGAEGFVIQSTYRFGMMAGSLEKKRRPIVYLDAKPYDYRGRCVKSNHYECVYQVITECIGKGYEDFMMFSDDFSTSSTGFESMQGYKDALQDAVRDGGTFYMAEGRRSGDVYEVLSQNLNLERRTLIYVADPPLYQVVYQALRRYPDYMELLKGRVGLIGFDCDGWTRMTTPPLAAIITPAYQEGVKAAEELMDILDGKKAEGDVVFKNIVKYRESVN